MKRQPKLILALDVATFDKARRFIDKLYPRIKIFKVGLQLFCACQARPIDYINKKGGSVFLDLKFFDIPNTVANALRQSVRLKVKMVTLHIAGGQEMIQRAREAVNAESKRLNLPRPLLIGVTVLTSQGADKRQVLKFAKLGLANGLDGVVCSAREAKFLRKMIKGKFVIVTPGIRPDGFASHDQKRTATVSQAVDAGSDYLVVGRPILESKDPLKTAKALSASCRA
jgi:orotidine-5'-phosphate decarboxylase